MSLIEQDAFRELLIYLEPRLKHSIPSRRSLGRYIEVAHADAQAKVGEDLRGALTNINISFDLWTSPGRRFSLLEVVAHYLNASQHPRNVLLGLPRVRGSHTAANIAGSISHLLERFDVQYKIGNLVTDNASENHACIEILGSKYSFNANERHVLCIGHVINLVAQSVLFGSDTDAFEPELVTSVEELELQ